MQTRRFQPTPVFILAAVALCACGQAATSRMPAKVSTSRGLGRVPESTGADPGAAPSERALDSGETARPPGALDDPAASALDDAGEARTAAGVALPNAAAPTPEASTPPALAAPPAGTTVLHVGDSFAGALGQELNRLFKVHGVRGVLRYKTSSYIPTWAWNKELAAHVQQYQPDLVLVTLGANELKIPNPEERIPAIQRVVERIGDRPCVWIAPPLWAEGQALLEVIRANIAPCVYMDTNRLLPNMERTKDAIHPSEDARVKWAAFVYEWLVTQRRPNAARVWELAEDTRAAVR